MRLDYAFLALLFSSSFAAAQPASQLPSIADLARFAVQQYASCAQLRIEGKIDEYADCLLPDKAIPVSNAAPLTPLDRRFELKCMDYGDDGLNSPRYFAGIVLPDSSEIHSEITQAEYEACVKKH
jgi:hypothetical protein